MKDLLEQVSRSFYLTLRVLPRSIRRPMGTAYLLARATDTIADTELVSVERRVESLRSARAAIFAACRGQTGSPQFGALAGPQSASERLLLERFDDVLAALRSLPANDRDLVRDVLDTITTGQESDLLRFGSASARNLAALDSDGELDEYTYKVAGCVGEFWTKMCRRHLFPNVRLDDSLLLDRGVRFGKGLQLVNILRDLPKDLGTGRCYIPRKRLDEAGLHPENLTDPAAMSAFRPLYNAYLDIAEAHLAEGWAYTKTIPAGQVRLRLACAWPILIGIRTLSRLRTANVLDAGYRVKVSRVEVRNVIVGSVLRYPNPGAWDRLFDRNRGG